MEKEKLCEKCKTNPAQEPHQCPYHSEINGDNDPAYCNCCHECVQHCNMEI